jgi:hypothetical protein
MKRSPRYVRQMPQIYGSLHETRPAFSWAILRTIGVVLFWVGAVALVLYTLFFSSVFMVKAVNVEGVHFNDANAIAGYVPQGINIWRLPVADIEKKVLALPAVDSVEVLRGLPGTVKIVVHEKQPVAIWSSAGVASLLDPSGVVFMQYPLDQLPLKGTPIGDILATEPVVIDTQNLPVSPEKPVVSSQFITFVSVVQSQTTATLPDLTIDHFEVGTTTYDLTMFAKQGMQVALNTLSDPAVDVRNLTRLVRQEKTPLTAKVDLQIDRWAYVQ